MLMASFAVNGSLVRRRLRAEAGEEHVGERPVHGFAHDDGEYHAARADKQPATMSTLLENHEARGRSGHAGKRIQQRYDNGHVARRR